MLNHEATSDGWGHWSRGHAGMIGLIMAEASLLGIFVVAYLFYLGKSLHGPYPQEVLEVPIFNTLCLLVSSVTIGLAVHALRQGEWRWVVTWLPVTAWLGVVFLAGTAKEWYRLIVEHGLIISTNLFGTTFYALVGLHALHVAIGVVMLTLLTIFVCSDGVQPGHAERAELVSWYWHFVDGVWLVVFTVVYIVGR